MTLAIDPGSPATVYAGTYVGLYKSLDSGASWAWISAGIRYLIPSTIAFGPSGLSTLYVGVLSDDEGLDPGVFKSVDAGASWVRIYGARYYEAQAPVAIAVDPNSPSRLYVALDNGRLDVSNDGGASWSEHESPTPDYDLSSFAVDPASFSTIYAGTRSGSIYRSTNAGAQWTLLADGLRGGVNVIAIAASRPSLAFAGTSLGIFRGSDDARNWAQQSLGVRALSAFTLAVDPAASSTIYLDVAGTLMKTSDGGAHWARSGQGLSGGEVSRLVIDPVSPSTLYAAIRWSQEDGSGVYKSTDAGAQWVRASSGLQDVREEVLTVAPSRHSTLYLAGQYPSVWRSTDGASSWTQVYDGLAAYVSAMAVDPNDADTVYIATRSTYNPYTRTCAKPTILKSTDGAATFREAPPLPRCSSWDFTAFAIDPSNSSTIYAAGLGVWKSSDGGKTWAATQNVLANSYVHTLAIDSSSPARLYAATYDGVFRSVDGATSWSPVTPGLPAGWVAGLAVDRAGSLLRAATGVGLFEYQFSDLPPTPASTVIGAGITGTWFDPAQGGNAFMLEVLSGAPMQMLATWFAFTPQGGHSWIFGFGSVSGDAVTMQGIQTAGVGARFPPNLDSANIQVVPWGTLTFRFSDCNHGHVDWSSTAPGYGSGGMDLTRLTLPAGLTCMSDSTSGTSK